MSVLDRAEEAAKLAKKATKFLNPSILDFRLKPDWEAAAPLLERAAVLFKQAGDVERALEMLEKSATAQERLSSPWHAAKHMESAADLCRQHKRWDQVLTFYKQAAEYYIAASKVTTAADALARGARMLEEWDLEGAMTLLYDAIDIYESETKDANAVDIFRQIISTAVKGKRYAEAVELQMRFGSMCERSGAHHSQCRCYLGAIVTHLYAKEAKEAWQVFQDALAIDAFVASEEAFAADALFSAYRSQDESMVQQVVKSKAVFKQLDNQVARLAMKLPQGRLEKLARRLIRAMGNEDWEEDLDVGVEAEDEGRENSGHSGRKKHAPRKAAEDEAEEDDLL